MTKNKLYCDSFPPILLMLLYLLNIGIAFFVIPYLFVLFLRRKKEKGIIKFEYFLSLTVIYFLLFFFSLEFYPLAYLLLALYILSYDYILQKKGVVVTKKAQYIKRGIAMVLVVTSIVVSTLYYSDYIKEQEEERQMKIEIEECNRDFERRKERGEINEDSLWGGANLCGLRASVGEGCGELSWY